MILTQLLGYCTAQLNLALRLTINDTILHIHYDFVSNFRPCAARFIYFLFTLKITSVKRYHTWLIYSLKYVMLSAVEVEPDDVFVNYQEATTNHLDTRR